MEQLDSEARYLLHRAHQWSEQPQFGLDFDMNGHPAAWGRKRGTCMIFTVDKQSVEETLEDVLKNEEGLVANAFCGLGDEKLMGVTFKTVRMWRMAAVGYRKNDFLEG